MGEDVSIGIETAELLDHLLASTHADQPVVDDGDFRGTRAGSEVHVFGIRHYLGLPRVWETSKGAEMATRNALEARRAEVQSVDIALRKKPSLEGLILHPYRIRHQLQGLLDQNPQLAAKVDVKTWVFGSGTFFFFPLAFVYGLLSGWEFVGFIAPAPRAGYRPGWSGGHSSGSEHQPRQS